MAKSKYEYVKEFEGISNLSLPPQIYLVIRIDGHSFHKFSSKHNFEKPSDKNALHLMNAAAEAVMKEMPSDLLLMAYGQSDEYSFVVNPLSNAYNRRECKLVSLIVSCFTSNYILKWPLFLPETKLLYAPYFDGRCVVYPNDVILMDYLCWRQADCHINNLYNTAFHALVKSGTYSEREAEERLMVTTATAFGTSSSDKNELLFSSYGINYNNIDVMLRKGSFIYRDKRKNLIIAFIDLISNAQFWAENKHLLPLVTIKETK